MMMTPDQAAALSPTHQQYVPPTEVTYHQRKKKRSRRVKKQSPTPEGKRSKSKRKGSVKIVNKLQPILSNLQLLQQN